MLQSRHFGMRMEHHKNESFPFLGNFKSRTILFGQMIWWSSNAHDLFMRGMENALTLNKRLNCEQSKWHMLWHRDSIVLSIAIDSCCLCTQLYLFSVEMLPWCVKVHVKCHLQWLRCKPARRLAEADLAIASSPSHWLFNHFLVWGSYWHNHGDWQYQLWHAADLGNGFDQNSSFSALALVAPMNIHEYWEFVCFRWAYILRLCWVEVLL